MKTPRDILLAQHRAAESKLDALRRAVVAKQCHHQATKAPSWFADLEAWCLGGSNIFWRELIFPNRRIWTGLAAVWIALAALNISQRESSPANKTKSVVTLELASIRDQQKLLNELLADRSGPAVADRPRIFSPKPRSETTKYFCV